MYKTLWHIYCNPAGILTLPADMPCGQENKERMTKMENTTNNPAPDQQETAKAAAQETAQAAQEAQETAQTSPAGEATQSATSLGGEAQAAAPGEERDGNYLLGKTCRDIVSGFEGICVGVVEWMYGCRQFIIKPKVDSEGKRGAANYLFEKQLEIVDDGITGKVEVPHYTAPVYFGKECRDKVTGVIGMCIGRNVWLFNTDQYVLEIQPEDHAKESRLVWLDDGRMEVTATQKKSIEPEKVTSSRPGGMFLENPPAYQPGINHLDMPGQMM